MPLPRQTPRQGLWRPALQRVSLPKERTVNFPVLDEKLRAARLEPPTGKVRVVLDTDTYNEVDDQFALAQMILSPDRMKVEAIHAAPFHNDRSTGPADGMQKSYEEILRLLDLLGVSPKGLVFKGSTAFMTQRDQSVPSESVDHLIDLAMRGGSEPLYVLAIGAITNVASALIREPRLVERIILVWLGGNELHCETAHEFNLKQDPIASQTVFNCGVPLVHIPCQNVTTHLQTTLPELEHYLKGKGPLADYLFNIVKEYGGGYAWSKVIWDVAVPSWILDSHWVPSRLCPSPILNDDLTYTLDPKRHRIRIATGIHRDAVLGDVFRKVAAFKR
jgi:hypothetical protein